MTIMKPTRKEVLEHYKECDHCRHWFKFLEKELAKKIKETDKPTAEGILSEWWNTQVCNGQGHDLGVLVEIALNRSDEYWRKVVQG